MLKISFHLCGCWSWKMLKKFCRMSERMFIAPITSGYFLNPFLNKERWMLRSIRLLKKIVVNFPNDLVSNKSSAWRCYWKANLSFICVTITNVLPLSRLRWVIIFYFFFSNTSRALALYIAEDIIAIRQIVIEKSVKLYLEKWFLIDQRNNILSLFKHFRHRSTVSVTPLELFRCADHEHVLTFIVAPITLEISIYKRIKMQYV